MCCVFGLSVGGSSYATRKRALLSTLDCGDVPQISTTDTVGTFRTPYREKRHRGEPGHNRDTRDIWTHGHTDILRTRHQSREPRGRDRGHTHRTVPYSTVQYASQHHHLLGFAQEIGQSRARVSRNPDHSNSREKASIANLDQFRFSAHGKGQGQGLVFRLFLRLGGAISALRAPLCTLRHSIPLDLGFEPPVKRRDGCPTKARNPG